ncbi:MAG: flagellar biosynthesis protein FlhA [Clostridia bacterium]|nr:flagellar biosynthesis protein FlhA [Clostridia bacterium]
MARVWSSAGRFGASDLILAAAVVVVVLMMVIPLPAGILSLLISLNIAVSLAILLATTYLTDPLELSVFPSLLLVTTLYRLALNVSSTRLILLQGDAGEVIRKFGEFVVGGNPVVGFIVFLILVLIQFLVITRGAERVAEVAARFTLDAMPGKQMAIDADLNAGLIDDQEARRRRREIEREADFYGAMDGASKFVKGDAIAALVIIGINIVGGFAVGMWQHGLSWNDALLKYTLLTVGEGISAQIPALLISTATGIVVTRAASAENLGEEMRAQVLTRRRPLAIAAATLGVLGLVPGLPKLPFFILAGVLGFAAWRMKEPGPAPQAPGEAAVAAPAPTTPEQAAALVAVDPMEIELGYSLLPLAEGEHGGELMARIGAIRRQVATDLGLVLPLVRVRDNVQLAPQEYVVKVRGVSVGRGELYLDRFLAIDPGGVQDEFPGIPTREPAFGLPAMWIRAEDRDRAESAGYTVVDPASVLATHLMEIVKRHAADLLTRQEVKAMLDVLRDRSPAVVDEIVPGILPLGTVHRVLQNLLRERVPIRDLVTILEALADAGQQTKDADALTETVRAALARQISAALPVEQGYLPVVALAPEVEDELARAATSEGAVDPQRLQEIRKKAHDAIQRVRAEGIRPVVLCSPGVRLAFRRLIERQHADVPVLAYHELAGDISVKAVQVVD